MDRQRTPSIWTFLAAILVSVHGFEAAAAEVGATGAGVAVPSIGCGSDGQVGPLPAPPIGPDRVVPIESAIAGRLAFFRAEHSIGVLGPRGWSCIGLYGSNGAILFVTPQKLEAANLLATDIDNRLTGPAIQASESIGDTSGRFQVARIIARVFPAHRDFAERVIAEGLFPATDFPFGAYPADRLTYRSDRVVEFETPAQAEGLGTESRFRRNAQPIRGLAVLYCPTPNLALLQMRLQAGGPDLAAAIAAQYERDVAGSPCGG